MWAMIKQQRVKKQLLKISDLYEIAYTRYKKALKDTSKVGQLQAQQHSLELDSLAFAYDELKGSYKELSYIHSDNELWKTKKPIRSEGSTFDSNYISNLLDEYPTFSISFGLYEKYLKNTNEFKRASIFGTSLVRDSVYLKLKADLKTDALKLFSNISATDAHILNMYILYLDIVKNPANSYIVHSYYPTKGPLLQHVAKETNTNIICYKEY